VNGKQVPNPKSSSAHQQVKGPSHSFDYLLYCGADVDIDDSAVPIDGSINNSSDLKRRFSPLLIVLFFHFPPRPVSQWKEIVLIASIQWTKALSSAVRPSCDRIGQLSKYTFSHRRDYVNNKLIIPYKIKLHSTDGRG